MDTSEWTPSGQLWHPARENIAHLLNWNDHKLTDETVDVLVVAAVLGLLAEDPEGANTFQADGHGCGGTAMCVWAKGAGSI